MVRKHVLSIREYRNETGLGEHYVEVLKIVRKDHGEKLREIYSVYGIEAVKKVLGKYLEVEHRALTKSHSCDLFGCSAVNVYVADEPFIAVIEEYHRVESQVSHSLHFFESEEREVPDEILDP